MNHVTNFKISTYHQWKQSPFNYKLLK